MENFCNYEQKNWKFASRWCILKDDDHGWEQMKNILLQIGYTSFRRLEALAAFANGHGWSIAFEDTSSIPRGWSGDGVLIHLRAGRPRLVAFAEKLLAKGVPVVDLSICHPEVSMARVIGDHRGIGALAAEHFEERHFRNGAFFAKDWTNIERLRLEGFRERWRGETPLEFVWRRECDSRCYDDWKGLDSWLGAKLAAAPKPLALFAFNDNDAARALNVALSMGLSVPEEVSILGVDDESALVENQRVPISSVRHDLWRLGWESAALLERLMEGEAPPPEPILIRPTGVTTRRSTAVVAAPTEALRKALALIGEHLADSFGMAGISASLGVSRATLDRMFATGLGTTPSREFLRQRIARAKMLLAQTDKPIKAIAGECGFYDSAHLTNVFRREAGTTPNGYRKRAAH